ncbi:MAG: LysR substrate-binding domain-containing protein [Gordonia sp. (in: high G+C Gram-positive bacteria)]|uniref:LysR substrate-binding domain-containing protein n=1 Tax=Gordonia sp. (in: high G+C Gram-positive bacteria) TaxID=84139 RepID=UPI0039E29CD1
MSETFRLAYVPGVMPAKWVRIFEERRPGTAVELVAVEAGEAADVVRAGRVDAALARPTSAGEPGLAVIRLYDEVSVVVVPKDHVLTAADELAAADLADETFLRPHDDVVDWPDRPGTAADHRPDTTAAAVELVAAGMALLVVPMSLARLHHRRDLTFRPITDAPAAPVGLLWPEPTSETVEEFIGVVRGRRAGSSRGRSEPAPKRSAKEKAAAKRAAREAAGRIPPRKPKGAGKAGSKGSGRHSTRRTPRRGGR